ncbi:MAG TPA: hypothetical protein VFF06_07935 [Polyangia bacterium]|nr:hypothetical protein [Polyangia bacterium]
MLAAGVARAQPARETPLLQDDLQSNRRTKIDAPKDDLDAQLDQALGGPQGFSTKELERIEDKIRAELRRDRPRATPRLIVFLYPGRVSAEKLKSMSEVYVDVELTMDPCDRNVCKDAVAKHIELVGRSVGQPVLSAPGYKLIFKQLTLKTSTQMHDQEVDVYQVPIADCIAAAARPGGGVAWLNAQQHADQDYEPIVTKAIARRAAERRVSLEGPPQVVRASGEVDVTLKVRGDRNRVQQVVLDALAAAAIGLRDNPKTPAQSQLDVSVDLQMRGAEPRRFRSQGAPVGLYVDRRLDGGALWSNYVQELKKEKGAQRMSFDDANARGGEEAPEPDDNAAIAVLSANFGALGGCARAEAARSPAFRGVTLTFRWLPSGKADGATVKEPALKSAPVARCLQTALDAIRLPRFSGEPRAIEYPIRLK